jgi:hypothetical protein
VVVEASFVSGAVAEASYGYNSILGETGERSKLRAKEYGFLLKFCCLLEAIGCLAGLKARGREVLVGEKVEDPR